MTITIRNWSQYQHYKHRNPPWIRLYTDLLDDPEFDALPPDQKWALVGLFLMAARKGNAIPDTPGFLARRLGIEPDLQALAHWIDTTKCVQVASKMLDQSKRQRQSTETETTTPAAPRRRPAGRQMAGPAGQVLRAFDRGHQAEFKAKDGTPIPYLCAFARDQKLLKPVLERYGLPFTLELVEAFWMAVSKSNGDPNYYAGKARADIRGFIGAIPNLLRDYRFDHHPEETDAR